MDTIYINHTTDEIYETKEQAMADYYKGESIDLYSWSEVCGEYVMRGYWEP